MRSRIEYKRRGETEREEKNAILKNNATKYTVEVEMMAERAHTAKARTMNDKTYYPYFSITNNMRKKWIKIWRKKCRNLQ